MHYSMELSRKCIATTARKRIARRLQETETGRGKIEEIEKKQKEQEDRRQEEIVRKRQKSCGQELQKEKVTGGAER